MFALTQIDRPITMIQCKRPPLGIVVCMRYKKSSYAATIEKKVDDNIHDFIVANLNNDLKIGYSYFRKYLIIEREIKQTRNILFERIRRL